MTLRDFKQEDAEMVARLHEEVLRETGAFMPGPWNGDLQDIAKAYVEPGGTFVVIEDTGGIVAMGGLRPAGPGTGEIKRMRVKSSLQRLGLRQRVLDRLIEFARGRGIRRVILDTTELQGPARRFYEKNGFTEYGRSSWQGLPIVLYERRLQPVPECGAFFKESE